MKLNFEIDKSNIVRIKKFYSQFRYDPFVKRRYERNIKKQGLDSGFMGFMKVGELCLDIL